MRGRIVVLVAIAVLSAVVPNGVLASSVRYTPLHEAVESADLILTGEIIAVGGVTDQTLGNTGVDIRVDRVLKGAYTAENISAGTYIDRFSSNSDIMVKKGVRAAFVLNKQDKGWRIALTHPNAVLAPNIPLLQMMIHGVKDERVLYLYTGLTQETDEMVIEYARDMAISGDNSVGVATHALRHPWVNCRVTSAYWIQKMNPTVPQVKQLMPHLVTAINDLRGETSGDRNACSRGAAYQAARHLMITRLKIPKNDLADFHWQDLYDRADTAAKKQAAEQAIAELDKIWERIANQVPEDTARKLADPQH